MGQSRRALSPSSGREVDLDEEDVGDDLEEDEEAVDEPPESPPSETSASLAVITPSPLRS